MLDAGHGGFGVTPGKRTPDGEYEWDFNNKVVMAATKKLEANGITVLRADDPTGKTDVPLSTRTSKANSANVDLYVSVHHNANTGVWGTWTGTETFTYLGSQPKSEKLASEVQTRLVKAYGLKDRGLKKANFHVVRETKMPAILVEGGYMDSTIDIVKLRDDSVLKAAGEAIADGIMAYFGIKPVAVPAPTPSQPETVIYRVRETWADASSQIGAFKSLDSAKQLADKNPKHRVFDEKGNLIYKTKAVAPTPKPVTPKPKPVKKPAPKKKMIDGIEVKGQIQIINVTKAAFICDKPSDKSKNLGTIKKGAKLPIAGSVPGWFEVIYEGKRAYVNDKYGKLL